MFPIINVECKIFHILVNVLKISFQVLLYIFAIVKVQALKFCVCKCLDVIFLVSLGLFNLKIWHGHGDMVYVTMVYIIKSILI